MNNQVLDNVEIKDCTDLERVDILKNKSMITRTIAFVEIRNNAKLEIINDENNINRLLIFKCRSLKIMGVEELIGFFSNNKDYQYLTDISFGHTTFPKKVSFSYICLEKINMNHVDGVVEIIVLNGGRLKNVAIEWCSELRKITFLNNTDSPVEKIDQVRLRNNEKLNSIIYKDNLLELNVFNSLDLTQ